MRGRPRRGDPRWILLIILFIILMQNFSFFAGLAITALLFVALVAVISRVAASNNVRWQDAGWWGNFIASLLDELGHLDGFVRELFRSPADSPNRSARRTSSRRASSRRDEERIDNRESVAAEAMARARWSVADRGLQLTDVGVLVYEGPDTPKIYRTSDIPTDAGHVRPFLVIECPAAGVDADYSGIRFNLVDGDGNLRFTSRRRYMLKPGSNFITPPTWFPLHDQPVQGRWTLEVIAGQVPIASHRFGWQVSNAGVHIPLTGDGEIDDRAAEWLNDQPQEEMSLDELLAAQATDQAAARGLE